MRPSIILSTLVIGAAALGVVACGSGDDDSVAGTAGSSTGIVSVANVGGTDVLATSAGKTLHSAAVENGGKILCLDRCTSFWDPMLASSADAKKAAGELDANLGVVRRPDGERQLTFDGLPRSARSTARSATRRCVTSPRAASAGGSSTSSRPSATSS
jgi:predicted lipoprotein with Yx(FWY)xxD motif